MMDPGRLEHSMRYILAIVMYSRSLLAVLVRLVLPLVLLGSGCPSGTSGDPDPDAGNTVDAFVGEPCATVDELRVAACGLCGTRSEICQNGVWTPYTDCNGQGVCAPGALGPEQIEPDCSKSRATCNASCAWDPPAETAPAPLDAECAYQDSRFVDRTGCAGNLGRFEVCDDTCHWTGPSECGGGCAGTRRTIPQDAEEICIPGGLYRRGCGMALASCTPSYDVWVSPYYVDRYPVTWRRYQQCVQAGQCTQLALIPAMSTSARYNTQDDQHPDAYVSSATWEQARAFCAWDGGRRLPTAAEWEKAARGPSPRVDEDPWGGAGDFQPYFIDDTSLELARYFRFDAYPESASYFGVELMRIDAGEFTSDCYTFSRYPAATVPPLRDPSVPTPADPARPWFEYRGSTVMDLNSSGGLISTRLNSATPPPLSIRCVRTAP